MPCNLAVSITKGAVTSDRLRALLTDDVVERLLRGYFDGAEVVRRYGRIYATLPDIYVEVMPQRGVTVVSRTGRTGPAETARIQRLTDQITNLLAAGADRLFAQQVQAALAGLGQTTAVAVPVDNEGTVQTATLITLRR